jgi:aspartate aminotransferase
LCILAGLDQINKYTYYNPKSGEVDFDSMLRAVADAPSKSIFILQACCHNPTGMDLSRAQWRTLAEKMKERDHLPFFDVAYQGLSGSSLEDGAFPVRLFAEMGFEMLACQSFSKNFGLYGERCGVLHVVTDSRHSASCVKDQLRSLIRWEFSSSPAYGSRLVTIILRDEKMRQDW